MDNKLLTLRRYKKALPLMKAQNRPCDFIESEVFRLSAELGYGTVQIDLDSIWEKEAKTPLYHCYITPDEAIIIQQYGRLIDEKLETRMRFVRKRKAKMTPEQKLRELIEKIEYVYDDE